MTTREKTMMAMERARIDTTNCPYCDAELIGAARPNPHDTQRPEPGDYSLCIKCGFPSIFGENMQLRELTEAEIVAAPLLDFTELNRMLKDEGEDKVMAAIVENYSE